MLFFRRVVGDSMKPTLTDGQIVCVTPFLTPKVGHVVVAILNGREVVKRIATITDDWQVQLLGDNTSQSSDSRKYGTIPKRKILGVVIWPKTNR